VGKPNVGKSTLLNAYLGRKIAITSPRPQTTRTRILGVLSRQDAQVIFVDSPGWHSTRHPFDRRLLATARGVMEEADVLLTVIEATSGLAREDAFVFQQIRRCERPRILAINKVDLVRKPRLLPLLERCAGTGLFAACVPISASTGDNLDRLLGELIRWLPEGPRWYEPEQWTDQTTEQLIAEFIREQVLLATYREVPRETAVLLGDLEPKEAVTVIRATILVEREGQKGIVIGHRGQTLKRIGQAARLELERLIGRRIFLELSVKLAKAWREDPTTLRELGYKPSR